MTKPLRKILNPSDYALSTNSEDAHQIALFMWASTPDVRAKYPEVERMFAIPNGGFRTKAGAGKLRAMGVKAGVPDVFLPVRRGVFGGLFVELKKPAEEGKRGGQTRAEQRDWGTYLKSQNYGHAICFGWYQARDMIISYLDYKPEVVTPVSENENEK